MRSMIRVVLCLVMVASVLAACGAAVPPVPGRGGPAWLEVTSEHFTVWTDADRARTRELVEQMEHLRQVIVGVAFPSVPADGRVQVFVLRDDDELAAFSATGEPRALAMTAGAPLWQPMIVLSAFSNFQTGDRTVAHELTHVISFAVVHHQPRWLSEGMAEFFQTVRLEPDRGTADVGVAPEYHGSPLRMAHLIPISKLFAAEPANVLARLLVAALDHAEPTVDQVRAMTVAHADDWRAWWVAAHVLSAAHEDAAEIAKAQRNACALFAKNPALLPPSDLCAGDRAATSSP